MEEEGSHVSVTLGRAFETVQDLVLSIRKNPDVFTLAPYREVYSPQSAPAYRESFRPWRT